MKKKLLAAILYCSMLLINVKAEVVINGPGKVPLGKEIEILQSTSELTFAEALRSNEFKKSTSDNPNLGISGVSTWVRFTLTNNLKSTNYLLDIAYPILDEIELFAADSTGKYSSILLGEVKRFKEREYNHPDYIFNLNIPQNTTKTYYLRIKSAEQIILPISVHQQLSLWQEKSTENLLLGIFIGAIIIMFLYNLFIFFSVKDKSYIYYVVYVASVGLTQIGIKGLNFQYLWGEYPEFELKSINFFACIGAIAAILFTKSFLNTKLRARKSDIVLNLIIISLFIAFLLNLSGNIQLGFLWMQASTTFFALGVLIVSGIVMYEGYPPAKFIFFSWSVLLIGAIIFALKDNGVLPYNTFTSYSMQVASVIEMALLSFGLADRINVLKKEKEASDAHSLAVAQENEQIIRSQNIVLERKVKERTAELETTNNDLSVTLTNLKYTQSQLVEAEKMASLGQLTAGIAHEINNPINFVTSNVAPLKRDVGILLEAVTTMEELNFSEVSHPEKQKIIDEYKEEIDFDYLKIEISHLLKGISEGASRTAEIVKGLRVFSRLDEDDLKFADLNEGLDSTLIIANNLLSGIVLTKEYTELPLIECYPGKLNQVFLNIITNAIHAIHKKYNNSAEGQLKLKTTFDEEYVSVIISDNGIGMTEDTAKKIYEPFFTTKDVGEGTGLGMSIAYNTIKKHNGEIYLNTVLNAGTDFIIKLPRARTNIEI